MERKEGGETAGKGKKRKKKYFGINLTKHAGSVCEKLQGPNERSQSRSK